MRLMVSMLEHATRPCFHDISYGQILKLSDMYMKTLYEIGVRPNDRIGILCSQTSPHQVAMMLAGWRKSAVIVPLPDVPHPEILPLVRPRVVLTPDFQISVVEEEDPYRSIQTSGGGDRPAFILCNSEPKAVVFTHKDVIHRLNMMKKNKPKNPCDDDTNISLPWYHYQGFVGELLFRMTRGSRIG